MTWLDDPRRARALLGALVLLGAALRFSTLDAQSYWRDEASTALAVRDLGLGALLEQIADREGMPPLHFVLAWLWEKPFGAGEVGLRSLSALAGTLTIPVAYALAGRLAGRAAAVLAAALAATSPFLVWYSQEARPYALLALLTALATLLLVRALQDDGPRAAIGWGCAAAAALATHYFAIFLLAPQALILLWRARAGRRAAAAGVGILAAAAVALAPLVLAQRDGRVDWVGEIPLSTRALDVAKHWTAGPFGTPVDAAGLLALLLALCGLALLVPRLRASLPAGAVAAAAAAALALPLVAALAGPDYVLDRYLIGALVPLLALAAAGFASRRAGAAAGVVLAAAFAAFTIDIAASPELHREDWRAVARELRAEPAVVTTSADGEPPLRFYLSGVRAPAPADRAPLAAAAASWRFGRPRPATPPAPPGYAFAGRRELPTATIVRYRAPGDAAAPAPPPLDAAEPAVTLFTPGA
ncbi:MAG TPA: glycosyltransferase family 39 protein [Solirubrobacteraceae bacterium]|nr:glycosyltransferase family 39 protein [Solirubrobacteraceae bacterium]